MENKRSKSVITLRILFATVTLAYIIGALLIIYVFGINPKITLYPKLVIGGVRILKALRFSLAQLLFALLPGILFVFSAILWQFEKKRGTSPKKK